MDIIYMAWILPIFRPWLTALQEISLDAQKRAHDPKSVSCQSSFTHLFLIKIRAWCKRLKKIFRRQLVRKPCTYIYPCFYMNLANVSQILLPRDTRFRSSIFSFALFPPNLVFFCPCFSLSLWFIFNFWLVRRPKTPDLFCLLRGQVTCWFHRFIGLHTQPTRRLRTVFALKKFPLENLLEVRVARHSAPKRAEKIPNCY
jgi:hypothetical protein